MSKAKDLTVPFSLDGNMLPYQYYKAEMRELPPFDATLRVIGMETGRSAKRFVLEDVNTGVQYPMFVSDMVAFLKDVDLTGTWEKSKRGANYGVRRAKE